MPDISVICCYNNKRILNAMLEKSLKEQINVVIETIFIKGEHLSAPELFNQALSKAQADHLVFVHQYKKTNQHIDGSGLFFSFYSR